MIKAILFDADGVVVKGPRFSEILEEKYGITRDKTEPFFSSEFQMAQIGRVNLREVLIPYLERWGWNGTVDDLIKVWFEGVTPDPQMLQKIAELRAKGIKCCLASNQEKLRAAYLANEMGLEKVFDKIFISAHIGHKKPLVEFFEYIATHLEGIKKEEILVWDDKDTNIDAARSFGFQAEAFRSFDDFCKKLEPYLT
ncbi:MAG: HAD-IA family hydrolase [Patescibacteria group bacterium]